MIPLGDLREDGLFDKLSILMNIPMSFSAWKSLLLTHLLTAARGDMKGNQRQAQQSTGGAPRAALKGAGLANLQKKRNLFAYVF